MSFEAPEPEIRTENLHGVLYSPRQALFNLAYHFQLRVHDFKNSGTADLFLIKAVPLLPSTEYEIGTYQASMIPNYS